MLIQDYGTSRLPGCFNLTPALSFVLSEYPHSKNKKKAICISITHEVQALSLAVNRINPFKVSKNDVKAQQ